MNRTSDMKKRLPGIILITGGIVLVAMVIQAVILSFIITGVLTGPRRCCWIRSAM